jgi:hypothetical protein
MYVMKQVGVVCACVCVCVCVCAVDLLLAFLACWVVFRVGQNRTYVLYMT